MSLATFLDRASRTPFSWGSWDCSLWLADWLIERGYEDPAQHLRGHYRTALGCARILKREGGVLGVVGACASRAGLKPVERPQAGDVGVVEAETAKGLEPVGAIFTGARWAILGNRGLVAGPFTQLAAWRV